ncbi:GNAT family N-acetyltransferase [Spirosoma rhododendri]|uniref:GNAT family N-acetyltransferase n=1 Tax=Spirosoma rhododendri TaxID=2728024 RepID=A0A7L5DRB7_9BACT|nr:GNAT family N-acetyltransferase [Spirosoma rhododendri]QJD78200.1 GNAT family N-acetyltransferase [Spirosoma rhododendri]
MKGNELDWYLNIGFFRMHQDMFTCQYVVHDNVACPVHWLRLRIADVSLGEKQRRLIRINAAFTVTTQPFVLTSEVETLYAQYKATMTFDAPESVTYWLTNGNRYAVFDTYSVEVRDNGRLIAVGIFDRGNQSIAGIMNFYHPDYARYSLGKYLMLEKIRYAQQHSRSYYYPGYLVSNYPKFDYKLFPCQAATDVFDAGTHQWLPFAWNTVQRLATDIFNEMQYDPYTDS